MGRRPKEVQEQEVVLTENQRAEAATNNPVFSEDSIVLGKETFKIVHLKYDDYIAFLTLLAPLFELLFSQTKTESLVNIDIFKIINICGTNLPELAQLVLKQTVSEITIEQVKELCPTPFKMAEVILLQIKHNEMIKDFTSFFPQLTKMIQV